MIKRTCRDAVVPTAGASQDRGHYEPDGYEICDLFERDKGGRVPLLRRAWFESLDLASGQPAHAASSSTSPASAPSAAPLIGCSEDSSFAALCATTGAVAVCEVPWVVLTPEIPVNKAMPAHSPPGKGMSKGGKGKGPPPCAGKAKGVGRPPPAPPKPPPFAKLAGGSFANPPKKAAPPPPFGKRLHWKLLPASSLEDTIFGELRPWADVAPPLDTRQLERVFSPPAPRPPPNPNGQRGCEGAAGAVPGTQAGLEGSQASGAAARRLGGAHAGAHLLGGATGPMPRNGARGQVCLLDAKRAQNLAIILRQVTVPTEELAEVLRWMRVSHPVKAEVLEHVYENLLPSLMESAELLSYDGPPEALRDVERQLLPLARLPRLKSRLQAMLFSKSMPTQHSSLLARIRSLRGAADEVRCSAALRKVLGMVLRVGNYLNHGVDAPDVGGGVEVRGFAMDSLLKFRDFRASHGSEVSALHCVVAQLLPSDPHLAEQLRSELGLCVGGGSAEGAGAGPRAPGGITDLRDAVVRFQTEIDLVQGEIERFGESYKIDGEEGCGPLAVFHRLVEDAGEMARTLDLELDDALATAWRLLVYFGEQRSEEPRPLRRSHGGRTEETLEAVERFLSIIHEFVLSFEECWREVLEQPRKLRLEGFSPTSERRPGEVRFQAGGLSEVTSGFMSSSLCGPGAPRQTLALSRETTQQAHCQGQASGRQAAVPAAKGGCDDPAPPVAVGLGFKNTIDDPAFKPCAALAAEVAMRRRGAARRVASADLSAG